MELSSLVTPTSYTTSFKELQLPPSPPWSILEIKSFTSETTFKSINYPPVLPKSFKIP